MKYTFLIIRTVFAFSLILFIATFYYDGQLVEIGSDFSDAAMQDPVRVDVTDNYTINFDKGDYAYKATPIADYEVSGVVLKRTDYGLFNKESDNAIQYDICMAWGSNLQGNLYLSDKPEYTQFKRACYFSFSRDNGFSPDNFSNSRLIINDEKLLEAVKKVNVGDEITMKGRLVNLVAYKKTDMNKTVLDWKASQNQSDDKKVSSEVIYLDEIKVNNPAHYKESIINYFAYWVMIISGGLLILHVLILMIFMRPQKSKQY